MHKVINPSHRTNARLKKCSLPRFLTQLNQCLKDGSLSPILTYILTPHSTTTEVRARATKLLPPILPIIRPVTTRDAVPPRIKAAALPINDRSRLLAVALVTARADGIRDDEAAVFVGVV
jgi:hypothetical protein